MPAAGEKPFANAPPGKENALDWPSVVSAALATFAVDRHMIAFYDGRPRAEVEAFQFKLVAKLLSHAARHSEWWRERLRAARDGRAVDFRSLPLMTREQFRASLEAAAGPLPLERAHGAASANSTSGSSGIPVAFYSSGFAGRMNKAHYHYDRVRQGIKSQSLLARLTTRINDHHGTHLTVAAQHALEQSKEFVRKSRQFTIEEHARWLSEVKPDYVIGHTGILEGILDVYEHGGIKSVEGGVTGLMSLAETVTPEFRSRARRLLGARVLDRYSCEETGPLAFQCPVSDDHYHIASTNVFVEVLDENGAPSRPGEIGRVFVTTLHNYASPVVRYELGDLAAWAPRCVCGYDNPVLTRLLGRTRFLVRLPSGERKHVKIAAKHWLSVGPITESRVVQVSPGVIRAEYVAERLLTDDECQNLRMILRQEISGDLTYELAQLNRIDWGPTYKRQDVVSLV